MTATSLVHWSWRAGGGSPAYDLALVPIEVWEQVEATANPPTAPDPAAAGSASSEEYAAHLWSYWRECQSMIPSSHVDPTELATAMFTTYEPPHPLALTEEECDRLIALTRKHPPDRDIYLVPFLDLTDELIDPTFRERLTAPLHQANAQWWRLDVQVFTLLMLRYDPGTWFPEHQDMHPGQARRKIAATVQLSDPTDYEGGDLLVRAWDRQVEGPRARGSVTVFPGWCPHEVTQITAGTRWSLVVWGYGPPVR